jgi:hypothetical protein
MDDTEDFTISEGGDSGDEYLPDSCSSNSSPLSSPDPEVFEIGIPHQLPSAADRDSDSDDPATDPPTLPATDSAAVSVPAQSPPINPKYKVRACTLSDVRAIATLNATCWWKEESFKLHFDDGRSKESVIDEQTKTIPADWTDEDDRTRTRHELIVDRADKVIGYVRWHMPGENEKD